MSSPILQKDILATVAYYDGFDYPLTAFEAWKHLINFNSQSIARNSRQPTLTEVIRELEDHNFKRYIKSKKGYYFLRGREDLVEERLKRNKISVSKLRKIRPYAWLLSLVPFVRMIGITGRLAMKNAERESDWDLLVVLKSGRIWTGRTLITALVHVLGKRRHRRKIKDRFCLNYFITDGSLELITRDLLAASEYFFIWPIFDTNVFEKFQIRNRWIRNYKPNYYISESRNPNTLADYNLARSIRMLGEKSFSFDFLEDWLASWQSRKIMHNPKTSLPGSFIRASNDHLIFLPEPQGPRLLNLLEARIEKF